MELRERIELAWEAYKASQHPLAAEHALLELYQLMSLKEIL